MVKTGPLTAETAQLHCCVCKFQMHFTQSKYKSSSTGSVIVEVVGLKKKKRFVSELLLHLLTYYLLTYLSKAFGS